MLEPDGLSNGSLSNPGDAVGSASMETLIANPSIAGSNDNVEDKPTNGAEDAWMPELDNTHVDYLTE